MRRGSAEGLRGWMRGFKAGVVVVTEAGAAALLVDHVYTGILFVVVLTS